MEDLNGEFERKDILSFSFEYSSFSLWQPNLIDMSAQFFPFNIRNIWLLLIKEFYCSHCNTMPSGARLTKESSM